MVVSPVSIYVPLQLMSFLLSVSRSVLKCGDGSQGTKHLPVYQQFEVAREIARGQQVRMIKQRKSWHTSMVRIRQIPEMTGLRSKRARLSDREEVIV